MGLTGLGSEVSKEPPESGPSKAPETRRNEFALFVQQARQVVSCQLDDGGGRQQDRHPLRRSL
jgi:hypothetical protein